MPLLGTNEICIAADVVTVDEQAELAAWADAQHKGGRLVANPADPGGFMTPYVSARGVRTLMTSGGLCEPEERQRVIFVPPAAYSDGLEFPQCFWRIRDRVIARMGLGALREDPYKGCFLSLTTEGGSVHRHVDARIESDGEELDLLRCNVLFQRPQSGGMPVIGPHLLAVPDRGMWSFYPTVLRHSATAVGGALHRGTLSYGFLVCLDERAGRRFEIASSLVREFGLRDRANRARFADMLRASADAPLIATQLDLVEWVIRMPSPFSVHSAAEACLFGDVKRAEEQLLDLQRKGFVESLSSREASGSVLVL